MGKRDELPRARRWRYRVVSAQLHANPEDFLNRYGDDGWEAVSVRMYADVDGTPYIEAVLKRPREEDDGE